MSGHQPWANLRMKMSPAARAEAEQRIRAANEQMLLAELRKHVDWSPAELAERLGISEVSPDYEQQDDLPLSTLLSIVQELDGELEIIVKLPKGHVVISPFDRAHV